MAALYHVTSTRNRESIRTHGLDWRRMGEAVGIAGSPVPEVAGCFVAQDEVEADYFVRMNNTGGPVDVWEVSGIDADEFDECNGYAFVPRVVPPEHLRLVLGGADAGTAFEAEIGTGFRPHDLT